jgi:hypothetical protein
MLIDQPLVTERCLNTMSTGLRAWKARRVQSIVVNGYERKYLERRVQLPARSTILEIYVNITIFFLVVILLLSVVFRNDGEL